MKNNEEINNEASVAIEDERALIACCMDEKCVPDVPAGAFILGFHNIIQEAMIQISARNEEINFNTIGSQISRDPGWARAGGNHADLVGCLNILVNPQTWRWYYEEIITERWQKREVGLLAMSVAHKSKDPSVTTQSLIADLKGKVDELSIDRVQSVISLPDLQCEDEVQQEKDIEHGEERTYTGSPTSIPKLNRIIMGLVPGRIYIVAARPAMGKTSLGLDLSLALAENLQKTMVISIEMNRDELLARFRSNVTGISSEEWYAHRTRQPQSAKDHARERLGRLPILIADKGVATEMDIDNLLREHKPKALIVDYLQLLTSAKGDENRNLEIARITSMLKVRAGDYDMPVVILSQLSRKGEGRRPILSDLRDSGAIEQDCDVAIFLHREDSSDAGFAVTDGPIPMEIHVLKNRHGKTGSIRALFMPNRCAFVEQSEHDDRGPYQ